MLHGVRSFASAGLLATLAVAFPVPFSTSTTAATSSSTSASTDRLVFCHFMVGLVGDRQSSSDWDDDMINAKALGIDAFALNIGTDDFTNTQLGYAYESAASAGMSLFISFDFNWFATDQGSTVGSIVANYAGHAAQLKVDGKPFVSSFDGDGVNIEAIRSAAGQDIFFAPNFHTEDIDFDTVDAAFNWMAWPSNGDNFAPAAGRHVSVTDGDISYLSSLSGKPYIAPMSPWFSTHYGAEVSYSKNWVFPADMLPFHRWQEILTLGPRFVEVITWNDYGESHYIGPLSSPHTDDGASKWVMDMPHDGWRDMMKPFIAAYKAGATDPSEYVTDDQLVYWYRPTPKTVDCDSTDTTMSGGANNSTGQFFEGKPNGWNQLADEVFVVALLKSAATVVVQSGSNYQQTFQAPAGISAYSVPMGIGQQKFSVTRGGQTVLSGTSLKEITDTCPCGIYNFNAYVGTLPAPTTLDQLQPEGLSQLTAGLKTSCPANTLSVGTSTATASG
ncbi:alpha-1-3-glucanase/mutanase [Penicillium chermesinum]|uniref:Alpha-1-3-glucanase/mutanase n=1 Tax=Penicillium chermesinum TaxID=63820 RepID=A0A9W9TY71_9EURO|nr:alpha-1-3-glucanase/mutanase [Penicillium chermesinum]KAJ5247702.1 alpha-1-3-glucanase/mutanase [Penicillium chermesinum]